jgi:hypothetical protein
LTLKAERLMEVMRAGRARWKIENETFNTLKNQGYRFEHNFGHGYQYLATVMSYAMMLAFLIDQIQLRCCALFNHALASAASRVRLWRKQPGRGSFALAAANSARTACLNPISLSPWPSGNC